MIVYGGLTLLLMLFIFMMSSQDGEHSGNLSKSFLGSLLGRFLEEILPKLSGRGAEHDIRKYAHMFEFFCLGISSYCFLLEWRMRDRARLFFSGTAAWGFCFLYACSDEWHQSFVPGRAGLFSDVLIDSAGFSAAILIMTWIMLRRNKKMMQ